MFLRDETKAEKDDVNITARVTKFKRSLSFLYHDTVICLFNQFCISVEALMLRKLLTTIFEASLKKKNKKTK